MLTSSFLQYHIVSRAQLVEGALLAMVIAVATLRARALTKSGAVAAFVIGTAVFGIGGWAAAIPLLTFFVTSTALSRWRKAAKQNLGYAKGGPRDSGQVLANGGVAALTAAVSLIAPAHLSAALYAAFLASLSAANADTWATEIGSASGRKPISLTTLRPAPIGASGAVSLPGTLALLAGAAVVAMAAVPFGLPLTLAVRSGVCGVIGALGDSILGATIQGQWKSEPGDRLVESSTGAPPVRGLAMVGNDCVNFLATSIAAAAALLASTIP